MRSRWPIGAVLALTIVAGLAAPGCSIGSGSGMSESEAITEAGFRNVSGLRVENLSVSRGMDEVIRFVLVGPSADVDRALAAASFHAEWSDGAMYRAEPPKGIGSEPFVEPSNAQDEIRADGGHRTRFLMRSKLPSGDEQLFVVLAG